MKVESFSSLLGFGSVRRMTTGQTLRPGRIRISEAAPAFSRFRLSLLAVAAGLIASAAAWAVSTEAPFLAENQTAMDKMMAGMEIKASGDVDHDFAAMMIPHHQGAIDMAQAELRHGRNEQLRRIAQEIIVEQQQEIAAMRLALGQPLPPSVASPDQPSGLSASAPQPTSTPAMNMRKEL